MFGFGLEIFSGNSLIVISAFVSKFMFATKFHDECYRVIKPRVKLNIAIELKKGQFDPVCCLHLCRANYRPTCAFQSSDVTVLGRKRTSDLSIGSAWFGYPRVTQCSGISSTITQHIKF